MTPRRRLVLRSPSNHDLILNAVAAGFVMEQDELVFALCEATPRKRTAPTAH